MNTEYPAEPPRHPEQRGDRQPDGHPDGHPAWYLAQCRPGQEHIAAQAIRQRDLAQVFLPREPRRRRWRGRWQSLLGPVFPGYLFLAPDLARPVWHLLRSTRGLSRIVAFGSQGPARVPAGLVAGLRARCDAQGLMQTDCILAPGDRVRILEGPFTELVARIEALSPDGRVALLLEMMGRETRLTLGRDGLAPAPA